MPIQLKHRERGIYCTTWSDSVTTDDMLESQEASRRMAHEDGLTSYILIFDMSAKPRIPTDMRHTGRLIAMDENVLSTIIVGASESFKVFSFTLTRIFRQMNPIEHFDTLDEALAFARERLSEMQSGAV